MRARVLILLALLLLAGAEGSGAEPIRRFVLAAGVNNGGLERALLRYAVTDAENFTRVLMEMGGLDSADCILLRNPDLAMFEEGVADLRQRVAAAARWGGGRLEVMIYYSGHADEEGLLIGGDRLDYRELRDELGGIAADVHIVVLDACASGTITRLKGGQRKQPFLVDESSNMRGYAILTSSSADEAAQESDRIKGSFFTHYLVSGMRGAADVTGDGKVYLNEAYQFAFDETLARTTGTLGGTQHPERDVRMNGSGDVVMTDLRQITAGLVLGEGLRGRFYVRNQKQQLVAELYKPMGRIVELGLEPGTYTVHQEIEPAMLRANVELGDGERRELGSTDFARIDLEPTVLRGAEEKNQRLKVHFSENFNLDITTQEGYIFSLGLFFNYQDRPFRGVQGAWLVNQAKEMAGSQVSFFGNLAQKDQKGWQVSSMANWTVGALQGGQISGGINIASQLRGYQLSGSTNIAKRIRGWQLGGALNIAKEVNGGQIGAINAAKRVEGFQLGVVNLSEDIDGVPLGIFNYSRTGLFNLTLWRDELGFNYATLASGSRSFYTAFTFGHKMPADPARFALGFGLGRHFERGSIYVDQDLSFYGIFDDIEEMDEKADNQLVRLRTLCGRRTEGGFTLFAGLSLNLLHVDGDKRLVEPWGGLSRKMGDDWHIWPGVVAGIRFGR